jgi:hypothetical protein
MTVETSGTSRRPERARHRAVTREAADCSRSALKSFKPDEAGPISIWRTLGKNTHGAHQRSMCRGERRPAGNVRMRRPGSVRSHLQTGIVPRLELDQAADRVSVSGRSSRGCPGHINAPAIRPNTKFDEDTSTK